jgi:hypothetical protein
MKLIRTLIFSLGCISHAISGPAYGEDGRIFEEHYFPNTLRSAEDLAKELGIGWPIELPRLHLSQKLTLEGKRYRCTEDGIEFGRKMSDQVLLWALVNCQGLKSLEPINGFLIRWGELDLGRTDYGITRNRRQVRTVKTFLLALKSRLDQKSLPQKFIRIIGEESTPFISRTEIGLPTYLTEKSVENLLDLARHTYLIATFTMPRFSKFHKGEYKAKIGSLLESLPVEVKDKKVKGYEMNIQNGVLELTTRENDL